VELDCESYSINIENDEAYTSSLIQASQNAAASSNGSIGAISTSTEASQGAMVPIITPGPTSWVDRPAATGASQSNAGSASIPRGRFNVLMLFTVVLTMSSLLR